MYWKAVVEWPHKETTNTSAPATVIPAPNEEGRVGLIVGEVELRVGRERGGSEDA